MNRMGLGTCLQGPCLVFEIWLDLCDHTFFSFQSKNFQHLIYFWFWIIWSCIFIFFIRHFLVVFVVYLLSHTHGSVNWQFNWLTSVLLRKMLCFSHFCYVIFLFYSSGKFFWFFFFGYFSNFFSFVSVFRCRRN